MLSRTAKKFVGETVCAVLQKNCGSQKVYGQEGREGVSLFSVENPSSQSAEKFRRGTLLCFRKFLVSKNVSAKRGVYQDFPSKTFCVTVLKIPEENPSVFH